MLNIIIFIFLESEVYLNEAWFDFDTFLEVFFLDDPELQDEIPMSYLSHKEIYEETIRKATIVFRKIRQMQLEGKDGVDNYL